MPAFQLRHATTYAFSSPVTLSPHPDYHLSADMAEKAIGWIGARDATDHADLQKNRSRPA